ncbi:hypothetical protein [Bradyrhizobium sp. C9]|uniref:hypothetical protein n=1 Tax=Bradyrhizobium sp. C9 TaxID=142585 RepID=UPI0013043D59|nr:hypothetical protein [Bradyrhizobium sp. C9]
MDLRWVREPARLIVEVSQIIIHEADEPNPVIGLFNSDDLTSEYLAEIDFLPVEADPTAGRDGDDLVMQGIVELLTERGSAFLKRAWGHHPAAVVAALAKRQAVGTQMLVQFEIKARKCAAARWRRAEG